MTTPEDIKAWLKRESKTRAWLASQLMLSVNTVNGWLSSGKPIPEKKLKLIEKLMTGGDELKVDLPPEFEKQLKEMAEKAHQTIDELVLYILEQTAMKNSKDSGGE